MGKPQKELPYYHKNRLLKMGYKLARNIIWRTMRQQVAWYSVSPASLKDHSPQYSHKQKMIIKRAIKALRSLHSKKQVTNSWMT